MKNQQEWSSMESSSNEIWDEIEMRFGHLVIRAGNQSINWIKQLWQFVIGNLSLSISHLRDSVGVLKNDEELKNVEEQLRMLKSIWECLREFDARIFKSVCNECF